MRILFLCTAFNSLSQRLALVLKSQGHAVTVELALSAELMKTAAELAQPDIVICPFLTKRVPPEVYNKWLTLIVHPGPPGDAGPSAIDWCLIGDLGERPESDVQLSLIDLKHATMKSSKSMRSHWGVTVLQAIEALDAGPIWAFDQFELDPETSSMSKSDLYRGPVTQAALNAVLAAIARIQAAKDAIDEQANTSEHGLLYPPTLAAPATASTKCVSQGVPFLGGRTHERPLLKASSRDFVPLTRSIGQAKESHLLSSEGIVQRINSADSQPGVLSSLFGTPLFLYNAVVQSDPLPPKMEELAKSSPIGTVLATREGAVLVNVGADHPIWICQLRKPKAKAEKYLSPKLPAVQCLEGLPQIAEKLDLISHSKEWSGTIGDGADQQLPWKRRPGTYQQVWVDLERYDHDALVAYVHFDFYNGATSTSQCEILVDALEWTLAQKGLTTLVLLGGPGYFSNGIALNVIEGSEDPSAEGWANINAIDDVVQTILAPSKVLTVSALRGNAAAGGLALATAADVVLCSESAVLNPHYRGLGLYGSEWHTYSWYERCGSDVAAKFAREMLPMSSHEALKLGLVDHIIGKSNHGPAALLKEIKTVVRSLVEAKVQDIKADSVIGAGASWTKELISRPAPGEKLLREQMLENKEKYLAYLFAGSKGQNLSLLDNFMAYRKAELGMMTYDFFHPYRNSRFASRCTNFVRKIVPASTPLRFALHRRFEGPDWDKPEGKQPLLDEEEMDAFDSLGDIPASAAVPRMPKDAGPTAARMKKLPLTPSHSMIRSESEKTDVSQHSPSTTPTTPRSLKPAQSLGDEEALLSLKEGLDKLRSNPPILVKPRSPVVISFEDPTRPNATDSVRTSSASATPRAQTTSVKSNVPAGTQTKPAAEAISNGPTRSSSSSRLRNFFSLGRKNKVQRSLSNETLSLSVSKTDVSHAVRKEQGSASSKVGTIPSLRIQPVEEEKPAEVKPAARRSSVSTVRPTSSGSGGAAGSASEKVDRRRSWITQSPRLATPLTSFKAHAGGGGSVGIRMPSDKTTEENVEGDDDGRAQGEFGESNEQGSNDSQAKVETIWSCYYSEDGSKCQRPVVGSSPSIEPISEANEAIATKA
ncbi:hypothetical protein IE53DRAFT_373832 [Violaceomyces palustris]|uniref:Uncharacterized protein n=1 Tax=Violaceomyces palustris TaxID=1673888 RepID=A0ACD0P1F3_9BASI|nr:hypothetical protein IE53DRAFT_373832 [Violaceomyces palustris]